MKYNKLIILLVVFALFIGISTVGSVSAASTGNNTNLNVNTSTHSVSYTIDKVAPKVNVIYPKNSATGVSRTDTVYIKFTEKIKTGVNWSKVYIKNLKTGKKIAVSKSISSNVLYIKTGAKSVNTWYQIYIPAAAVKDIAGNNFAKSYTWKFKTGTSATILIDKGNITTYSSYKLGNNDARVYSGTPKSVSSWKTYKYIDSSVRMVFTKDRYKYYDGNFVYIGTSKNIVDIVKYGSGSVKVTQSKWYSGTGKTTKYVGYWKMKGGNAVNFYRSSNFKDNYLNMYIKY